MNSLFSEIEIRALDFIGISAAFVLTMVVFFGIKKRSYMWLIYFLTATFVMQCIFTIVFRDGLTLRLFATLMLISTVIVEVVVTRRRRLEVS